MHIKLARAGLFSLAVALGASAQAATPPATTAAADAAAQAIEAKMIGWRRDFHQHPELGNAEVRSARIIADHLKKLGMKVRTGVAKTGVVGVLEGGRPGPTVALRADMDALPVKENLGLPFESKATGTYRGQTVPVMHACGHDTHMAILMATAEILAGMKKDLPGKIVFLFQPAEEGPSDFEAGTGQTWGAKAMVEQGALADPKPDAIFGLHVFSGMETGTLAWRAGPLMASADSYSVTVTGRQTHGALPWRGVDPVVASAQIINGLQTIVSRQLDISKEPAIVSVGQIHGGVRYNIIPDEVMFEGTLRAFDEGMRADMHKRVAHTSASIAEASGAKAETKITKIYDVTSNDPALTAKMRPTLVRVAGSKPWTDNVQKSTGAEDFSELSRVAPSLFLFLGISKPGEEKTAAANHSPFFYVDEAGLIQGVRALTHLTVDYLHGVDAPAR
jgi:amidohydrolase